MMVVANGGVSPSRTNTLESGDRSPSVLLSCCQENVVRSCIHRPRADSVSLMNSPRTVRIQMWTVHCHRRALLDKIVPLESKYARGRWNCFDYYDKETSKVPRTRVSESGESRRVSPAHGRSVRSLNSDLSLQGAVHHSTNPTIAFDDSSESDRENNEVFARSTPAFSRTSAPPQVATIPNSNDNVAAMNIKRVPSRSNRKSTDERLQRGLESSLAPHEIRSRMNPKRYDLLSGAVSAANNGMGQPSTSAIDSKIEQAMDLVKTHLMFAVREELDVLRGKITKLEAHIFRLENENAVFKANIPDDILRNLSLDRNN